MRTSRPTIPLIPDLIDLRFRNHLGTGPNTELFGGWGVGLPNSRFW